MSPDSGADGASVEKCAWQELEQHASLLSVPPIDKNEFLSRQQRLASSLKAAGVDAFIAEPSASTAYYFNISASFDLSERPFLVILDQDAEFSYLVPSFEAGRISALDMVYKTKTVIQWEETKSPYAVLKENSRFDKVMLDEHARFMIAAGLEHAGIDVLPMSTAVQKLRAVKQPSEIAILRAINSFTLQLVRALRPCIRVGMTQEEVTDSARALFTRAGVGKGFWAIVLFGDQAAFPHGGKHGKTLQDGEFVLVDIGSKLHDYGSDVTRTILPPGGAVSKELWDMWHLVHAAQSAGFRLMLPNQTCSDIDAASRKAVEAAGLGPYYTHRLGHGLGLEMHEHPYLNGANSEKLSVGEVATNEPGIYVTTDQAPGIGWDRGFGIRLEDPILVTEEDGEPLTGRRAVSPFDP
ncbi:peptidase M24, structural domain-containing protein [Microdochium bolleyi]|uniref:Probable Xaa-Pro aminopeptidase P n=1 Tax=Microdochium bolleyi TaxID=196109 RepID=A0A136JGK1_9PEZI|nr:peptidase M24, structural domain-containing protein [Microdochium bolleyi]